MKTIQQSILDLSVTGLNLQAGSLRTQLDQRGTLLVFLRHFG